MTDLRYATGIDVGVVTIRGWQAWALVDTWPSGGRRLIALLDEEALERVGLQAREALAKLRGEQT